MMRVMLPLFMAGVVFAAASAEAVNQGGYGQHTVIDGRELSDRIGAGGAKLVGFYWVDLRTEADYKKKFVPGSINIPFKKLPFLAEKYFSKSDEIVFLGYPDADHVSVNAVVFMKNKGFMRCSILKGGVGGWTGDLETAGKSKVGR